MERLRALDDGAAREAYWQLQLPETCTRFAPHLPEVQRRAPCAVTTRASPRAGLFVCLRPPRARLPMAAHGTRDHCPRHPGWPRHPTAPHGTPRHPMAPHGTPRHPTAPHGRPPRVPACSCVLVHPSARHRLHPRPNARPHPHPHHATPTPLHTRTHTRARARTPTRRSARDSRSSARASPSARGA